MGVLSEQHSFEGNGIRQQLTICCQPGGHHPPDMNAFALCIWLITWFQTAPFTNCALGYYYSFIQGLSWWNQQPPASSLITLSHQTNTSFIWLLVFINDGKKKNKATHSFLNSAQKILHWTIYHLLRTITRMNKTIRQNKKQHSLLVDLRNLFSAGLCIL